MRRRAILLAGPLVGVLATPAVSEGILAALFGIESAPPPPRYYDHRVLPTVPPPPEIPRPRAARPAPRPKPELVRLPPAETKRPVVRVEPPSKPLTPKPMGEVENPLPKLLADATLRDGDIVIFPDGPRVFRGQIGPKHQMDDFAPVTKTNVAAGTRKLLAAMKIGPNSAWSDEIAPQNRMAARNVETTGSLRKRARR